MTTQQDIDYHRVANAIAYIHEHFKQQPSLDDIAASVNLSPFHFQRLFSQWAGVSPKKFMQYISIEHAKNILNNQQSTLLDAAHETGLSGTSRLHDLFVSIQSMTPGEFKNGGASLNINYSFTSSPFGKLIVASTSKGICQMFFEDDEEKALDDLTAKFPNAAYHSVIDKFQQDALFIFQQDWSKLNTIKLHLSGTAFQLKVWESLLTVPTGTLTTYGSLAKDIGNPKASRAVGTAIGSNPVSFLIPCHRVIQASGHLGGYRWGTDRKSAMIGWEAAQTENE
mgnify:CR=1 FL=1